MEQNAALILCAYLKLSICFVKSDTQVPMYVKAEVCVRLAKSYNLTYNLNWGIVRAVNPRPAAHPCNTNITRTIFSTLQNMSLHVGLDNISDFGEIEITILPAIVFFFPAKLGEQSHVNTQPKRTIKLTRQ